MTASNPISRRSLLAVAAAAPLASAARKRPPVGLELYSVREELKNDLMGTVRAVAKMGYEGVEFFSPYADWTPDYAREVRALLNDLGMPCLATHNGSNSFAPDRLARTIELNRILGSRFIVMASAGRVNGLDGWKAVAETLTRANEQMKAAGMRAGFHNHQTEFMPIDGVLPMEVLARNTPRDVVLQLDVGTCLQAKVDPVAWINKNPGRIGAIHLKDWSPDPAKGYRVLLGEGAAPWKKIFQAAERKGGLDHYLVEQEGSAYPPLETAQRCLAAFKKLRG